MEEPRTRTLAASSLEQTRGERPRLEVLQGPTPGRSVEVGRKTFTIGRSVAADLPLDADGVSRKHARLAEIARGEFQLIDLGSTNGTYLNDRRIEVAALRDGDRIRVGQVTLRFGFSRADAAPATAAESPLERLSTREREVAELVAEGLTNAAIGKRLFISGRTVATHLANIYERLDIHSRAALARCVAEWRGRP